MSLREKAGQVLVADWTGTTSPAPMVRRLHLGGVIAFSANITSAQQIRRVNRSVAQVFQQRGYPGFLAVDQEGGIVSRVGAAGTPFPAFMATGAAADQRLTGRASRASAAQLGRLGFDVVLAPVADVTAGDRDAVIGSRSAGGDPAAVSTMVLAAARGISAAGLLPVVKHFPGHGSLDVDSHVALPVQQRPLRQLRTADLVPFRAAIGAHLPAVMTGHIDVRAVDPGVPASISPKVTTGLLRAQMGFSGLVVTDALDMGGVQRVAPGGRAAVRALLAGADVALMPPDPREARDRIVRAVRSGHLPVARLDEAAARMVDTLLRLRRTAPGGDPTAVALALARASVTSVAGPCTGRLIPPTVRVDGPPDVVGTFERTMAARGVAIAHDTRKRVRDGFLTHVVKGKKKFVKRKKKLPSGKVVKRRVPKYRWVTVRADAPTVTLVGPSGGTPAPSDVLVALDRPAVLGRSSGRVELATYGESEASFHALADVLMGARKAPGHLPLAVPGVTRNGC